MEFSADTSSFAEALDQVQEAVERSTTIPILSHVLVEASPSGPQLAATDLELGIRAPCPAQLKAGGRATAPARRLLEIVRFLLEGDVRVRTMENHSVQAALAKNNFPTFPTHSRWCLSGCWPRACRPARQGEDVNRR
jgi:DNA polymerase-3 subunit beta